MSSQYTALVERAAEEWVGPYANIYFKKITTWELQHVVALAVTVIAGSELYITLVTWLLSRAVPQKWLPFNPRQNLDVLTWRDYLYLLINKVTIVMILYHTFQLTTALATVRWKASEATLGNSVLVLVPMYLLYDLLYAPFHKLLHQRCLYRHIHKHHHRQASPTRGHYDAINVHPVEFLGGGYIMLAVYWAVPCHIFAVMLNYLLSGLLAHLNHTRYDLSIPWVYDAKDHQVHHRLPDYNFGQYTMFWDKLFGWHMSWHASMTAKSA